MQMENKFTNIRSILYSVALAHRHYNLSRTLDFNFFLGVHFSQTNNNRRSSTKN